MECEVMLKIRRSSSVLQKGPQISTTCKREDKIASVAINVE